jgi:hypothetical protein
MTVKCFFCHQKPLICDVWTRREAEVYFVLSEEGGMKASQHSNQDTKGMLVTTKSREAHQENIYML